MPSKRDRKCRLCPAVIARENRSGLCSECYRKERAASVPSARVTADRERIRNAAEVKDLREKYAAAVKTIERQDAALGWLDEIRKGIARTFKIEAREGSGTSEATPILIGSDWHSEEIVKPASVNGLNEFNPEIEERRVTRFFQGGLRLIKLLNQDVKIHTVVLALLGDFITNNIHGEMNAESNASLPIHALINVQNQIVAGLQFLLNNSTYSFVIPCKVGNHSRTTHKVHHATETGHSLETLMYVNLASLFKNEPRIRFVIEDGYHTYLDVYDRKIRFHHGHDIQYAGGVGGLFIPAFKAINQWNKARWADLDIFGHFHQDKDGGNFICNGSLIGYNAYALSIKADFEPPSQTLLLIDKKRRRTCKWPVLVGDSDRA
jgi:hypothetical protein